MWNNCKGKLKLIINFLWVIYLKKSTCGSGVLGGGKPFNECLCCLASLLGGGLASVSPEYFATIIRNL